MAEQLKGNYKQSDVPAALNTKRQAPSDPASSIKGQVREKERGQGVKGAGGISSEVPPSPTSPPESPNTAPAPEAQYAEPEQTSNTLGTGPRQASLGGNRPGFQPTIYDSGDTLG